MRKKKKALILIFAVFCMMVTGCGVDDIDISGYQTKTIAISGATEDEKELYLAQMKQLNCITEKTHSADDESTEVWATGPLLETVLESCGASVSDFSAIRIYGKDQNTITLEKDFLEENDVILAYGINGKALDKDSKPLRIVIPESDSAYWIGTVSRIECVK